MEPVAGRERRLELAADEIVMLEWYAPEQEPKRQLQSVEEFDSERQLELEPIELSVWWDVAESAKVGLFVRRFVDAMSLEQLERACLGSNRFEPD